MSNDNKPTTPPAPAPAPAPAPKPAQESYRDSNFEKSHNQTVRNSLEPPPRKK